MKNSPTSNSAPTRDEIFLGLKDILLEVAPFKIKTEVTPDKSLTKDYAFDSIDTMAMLLKVKERFLCRTSVIDVGQFVKDAFQGRDSSTVSRICVLIGEFIQNDEGRNHGRGD